MPKGLTGATSVVAIGFDVTESAANTFAQGQVDLNLSALDREVFVVLAVDLDPSEPDVVLGTNTAVSASLTSTSQTAVQNLSNANCMANARLAVRAAAGETAAGAPFSRSSSESPASMLDYLGIIATNDFFVQCEGTGNTNAKKVSGKMYGYRATASADIYAALVQSEVLSA